MTEGEIRNKTAKKAGSRHGREGREWDEKREDGSRGEAFTPLTQRRPAGSLTSSNGSFPENSGEEITREVSQDNFWECSV